MHLQVALQRSIEKFECAYLRPGLSWSHETLHTYASPHEEQMYLNVDTPPPLILIGPWVLLINIFGFKWPTTSKLGVCGLFTKSYPLHGRNHIMPIKIRESHRRFRHNLTRTRKCPDVFHIFYNHPLLAPNKCYGKVSVHTKTTRK